MSNWDVFVEAAKDGFKIEYHQPWGSLTDEANARSAFSVTRTIAPFCDNLGTRMWLGASPEDALNDAYRDLEIARRVVAAQASPALPREVLEWADAYRAYVESVQAYNVRLANIRAREAQFPDTFGQDNPDAEWDLMHKTQRDQLSLIAPMFEAIEKMRARLD